MLWYTIRLSRNTLNGRVTDKTRIYLSLSVRYCEEHVTWMGSPIIVEQRHPRLWIGAIPTVPYRPLSLLAYASWALCDANGKDARLQNGLPLELLFFDWRMFQTSPRLTSVSDQCRWVLKTPAVCMRPDFFQKSLEEFASTHMHWSLTAGTR